jgi:argininosuccinate lyase
VTFRDAHEISGELVRFCEQHGLELDEPTDAQYAEVSSHLTPEIRAVLTVRGSIGSRQGVGGTAPERVAEQLAELTQRVARLVRDLDPVSA